MKQNIKTFNFCDFNFKQKSQCVNKNELTILEHYNLRVNDKIIKPVFGFVDFLKSHFGTSAVNTLFENNPGFENNFIFVSLYEYFDETQMEDKSIVFAISETFELYEISFDDSTITSLEIEFETMPVVFENNSKYYFYSRGDKLICFDRGNSFVSVSNFVELTNFVDYQDKTFFTVENEPNKVFFTEKIDIEEIDESLSYENISLSNSDGKILKLVKFKGNLYIIQQYAVSKLSGNEKNYYLNSNCNISAKIFDETISKVNDYIIFYTSSGLFLFDGNEIKQIFCDTTEKFCSDAISKGIVFNNKYYLLTSMYLGGNIHKCLVEFDIYNNKSCNYFLSDIEDIYLHVSPSCYELLVVTKTLLETKLLKFDYSQLVSGAKYLKFNDICFDDSNLKRISGIKIISNGEFDLQIVSDKSRKCLHIKDNMEIDNLGLAGYLFQIILSGNQNFELKSMVILVETITN